MHRFEWRILSILVCQINNILIFFIVPSCLEKLEHTTNTENLASVFKFDRNDDFGWSYLNVLSRTWFIKGIEFILLSNTFRRKDFLTISSEKRVHSFTEYLRSTRERGKHLCILYFLVGAAQKMHICWLQNVSSTLPGQNNNFTGTIHVFF